MEIAFAANNGDIGGGEVMLLALAKEASTLGHKVCVVGPRNPDSLVDTAQDHGFRTVKLRSKNRLDYMNSLRQWWRTQPSGILWCNGLLPAVATAGMKHRIVHLHQVPSAKLRNFLPLATLNSRRTIVPSNYVAERIGTSSLVMPNWSYPNGIAAPMHDSVECRIGFIGRFSSDKGLPTLIRATNQAQLLTKRNLKLVLAGEPRFVGAADQRRVQDAIGNSSIPIEHVGWVDPSVFFSAVDLVVVPSNQPESFGLVAAEAMSARVLLIVTDAGALPETVGKGHPLIAPAGDCGALAEMIAAAISIPSVEKKAIAEAAFKRWQTFYSPAAGRQRLENLLNSLERV